MEGEQNTELELNNDELVDVALGTNYGQGFVMLDENRRLVKDVPFEFEE